MIRHAVFFQPEYVRNNFVRHLIYRKRRHVTFGYTYSSHGLFYVLFLLIYGLTMANAATSTTTTTTTTTTAMATMSTVGGREVIVNATQTNRSSNATNANQLVADGHPEDSEYEYIDEIERDYQDLISNKSARGMYIGAPCELKCTPTLHHAFCDASSGLCACEKKYPVVIGLTKGCAKPKKLGEQCFYDQTCLHNDANSLCIQIRHNALCQCIHGYHSVSYLKPTKRVFCTEDMATLTSDLPTLLGVTTGIAVLAGLICLVLHLFSKNKYPNIRRFNDSGSHPPIIYSSDTVQSARPSSRSSIRSSNSIDSFGHRRPSSAPHTSGSKGILVSTSRSGSRRPSLASVHSTSSSIRSYGAMRLDKEKEQKEMRHEMKLRLTRLQQQQQMIQNRPHIVIGDSLIHCGAIPKTIALTTPSPLTPNSLDELLPCVIESQEPSPPVKLKRNETYGKSSATLREDFLD